MSKVVFVGNVPYNMGEDQLIDVFKSVGQVVGFRLVFDRETGKPRGYGFCEFADHETALSAVRNLNNTDVGGRPLRIDLADSDPFLEGKTTVRGELIDGGTPGPSEPRSHWRGGHGASDTRSHDTTSILAGLPPGVQVPKGASALDYISQTLASMPASQLMEVLAQMKAFVITHPEQARTLLVNHPQLAYALFQALLLNKIVDSAILQRMLAATSGAAAATPAPPPAARPPVPPHHLQQPPQYPPNPPHPGYPPPPSMPQQQFAPPGLSAPPTSAMYPHHQHPQHPPPPPHPGMPPMPPYYGRPPPAQSVPPPQTQPAPATQPPAAAAAAPTPTPEISESQRAMLLQVFSMTPEQINAFSETERVAIQQLRSQFMGNLGA
ncbi:putative hinge domain of cleavage stimulation factor subunit 2 [Lyophyllum shimeji]|uniref:Hinge domain of cleavage stimulation factor subunit 2 n=1 Tax=Lyophyllum shimeji TaxID=47721 RepID=A0A9P3PQR4_LYOSH|nr:putative hinge domain of cleavage stimulation factor subunit 2 [Lyophyllum shimeji]